MSGVAGGYCIKARSYLISFSQRSVYLLNFIVFFYNNGVMHLFCECLFPYSWYALLVFLCSVTLEKTAVIFGINFLGCKSVGWLKSLLDSLKV